MLSVFEQNSSHALHITSLTSTVTITITGCYYLFGTHWGLGGYYSASCGHAGRGVKDPDPTDASGLAVPVDCET